MGRPKLEASCDKCSSSYSRPLIDTETFEKGPVPRNWLPKGWSWYDTQDGDGPEPEKKFLLCNKCVDEFKLTVRDFKPKDRL